MPMFHLGLGSTPRCIPQRPTTCRLPPVQNRTEREAARPLTLACETDTYLGPCRARPHTAAQPHRSAPLPARFLFGKVNTRSSLPTPLVHVTILFRLGLFPARGNGEEPVPWPWPISKIHWASARALHVNWSEPFGPCRGRHANHRLLNPNRAQRPKRLREHAKGQEKKTLDSFDATKDPKDAYVLPQPGPSLSVFRRCLGRSRRAHDHISRARAESFLLLLSTASKSHAKRGL